MYDRISLDDDMPTRQEVLAGLLDELRKLADSDTDHRLGRLLDAVQHLVGQEFEEHEETASRLRDALGRIEEGAKKRAAARRPK